MDVSALYTAASFRNTNLIESSLSLKWFSESSSRFRENLKTSVPCLLQSSSYKSFLHSLPDLLFWAPLSVCLIYLSSTTRAALLLAWNSPWCSCTSLPLADSPGQLHVTCKTHTSTALGSLLSSPSSPSVHTLPWSCLWDLLSQRVIIMICVRPCSPMRSLSPKVVLCVSQFPTSRIMPGT